MVSVADSVGVGRPASGGERASVDGVAMVWPRCGRRTPRKGTFAVLFVSRSPRVSPRVMVGTGTRWTRDSTPPVLFASFASACLPFRFAYSSASCPLAIPRAVLGRTSRIVGRLSGARERRAAPMVSIVPIVPNVPIVPMLPIVPSVSSLVDASGLR